MFVSCFACDPQRLQLLANFAARFVVVLGRQSKSQRAIDEADLETLDGFVIGDESFLQIRQGMMAIAERIAELRKAARLTQAQLAEEIGVSQPVISAIERGELRVHGELIIELAKLFKVTADDILGLKPPKKNPTDKMTPEVKRLWAKFQQISEWPEKDQRAVIRLINTVSKTAC